MDFFDRQWSSYRAIVEHDLMEHRAVAAATAAAIERWLTARGGDAPAPTMVDLGCGDLALLAPLLRRLPLGSYTGLDLAAVVLPLAQAALGAVPYPARWQEGDLLAWAQESAAQSTDILHSAFAIHHLDDDGKARFLRAARRRISPDGLFLWVDVFREPLTPEQQEHVISHLSSFDIPADRDAIAATARACGWSWHWAWQGSHNAEAMAVLTPA
jgi:predicted TPR repeat methyltransferase